MFKLQYLCDKLSNTTRKMNKKIHYVKVLVGLELQKVYWVYFVKLVVYWMEVLCSEKTSLMVVLNSVQVMVC